MKRKILYISGTRADFGLMTTVLKKIDTHPHLSLEIVATGMHLMEEFGMTVQEIQDAGFSVRRIDAKIEGDNTASMVRFIGNFLQQLGIELQANRPDMILVLGDRGEMLAGAIAGSYMNIPVVHIHGGEISSTVDDITRHAITKLSHIHLAATEESAHRIARMGEDPSRIFIVGAPGLDELHMINPISQDILTARYGIDPEMPLILVLQHPVSQEACLAADQIKNTLDAVLETGEQAIIIYPNADAGGSEMIRVIHSYKPNKFIRIVKNIPHNDFLSLLRISSVLVGNSSSGIIEAPSLGIPVVNIGTRQWGRQRAQNVIDTGYEKDQIAAAIRKALTDATFIKEVRLCRNPYGDGKSADKIIKILNEIRIDAALLQKRMTY
nr:UDP-N-acetylglucosamine 2-epimerase [uncultured Methanoregula sp.]